MSAPYWRGRPVDNLDTALEALDWFESELKEVRKRHAELKVARLEAENRAENMQALAAIIVVVVLIGVFAWFVAAAL